MLVVAHHLFERLHGFLAADEERHDHAGENHDVTKGQDRIDPVPIEFGAGEVRPTYLILSGARGGRKENGPNSNPQKPPAGRPPDFAH